MNNNNPIRLRITDCQNPVRAGVVVSGVPLPRGYLTSVEAVCVLGGVQKELIPCSLKAVSRWSDGSVRWCLIKALVPAGAREIWLQKTSPDQQTAASAGSLQVEQGDSIVINDRDIAYHFVPGLMFPKVSVGSTPINNEPGEIIIADSEGAELPVSPWDLTLLDADSISATIAIKGRVQVERERCLNLTLFYEVFTAGSMVVTCEVHNPHRAQHPEGIWDLGDAGSLLMKSLHVVLGDNCTSRQLLRLDSESQWREVDNGFALHQASSGGEHWNCPTHVNRFNECTHEFNGYRISLGDAESAEGSRASPALLVANDNGAAMSVVPMEFWQNFPKQLTRKNGQLSIGLFPPIDNDCHEIQGGERKQHRIQFSFGKDLEQMQETSSVSSLDKKLIVDRECFTDSGLLGNPVSHEPGAFDELLQPSLNQNNGFFAKREAQDEFGWRHFGDVVADHETLYHTDQSYFISHYNNQYDCVFGFARQFLLTGDDGWFRLMDELARHVMDIDIYRTEEDRAEYNYGLFWHTDHYQKASTATHRTYSRDHYPEEWSGPKGGGPGPEHCYTSGLKLYHYITGNADARDTVIRMTEWISSYYEGSGTLIEYVKSVVSHDLKKLVSTVKGQPVLRYRYPFNRGVGNYIRALMDSHELTADTAYLLRAAKIIDGTFSASDDIDMRHLDDIEGTWFYTVFLQEVIRFLDVKRELVQFDEDFYHTLDGLLHYARWMAENEKPYLLNPEKLEYPNDTWAAQDIRKANVLYGAYCYAHDNRESLLERARYFRGYVIDTLKASDTLHFARIQALLLQNHGPADVMSFECEPHEYPLNDHNNKTTDSLYRASGFLKATAGGLVRTLKTTSPVREYNWVRARLGK